MRVQAEKMVKEFEEMGNALGDVGLAFIKCAKYEDEEGARTGSYTDSSSASKAISANARRIGMVHPSSTPHRVQQRFSGCEQTFWLTAQCH